MCSMVKSDLTAILNNKGSIQAGLFTEVAGNVLQEEISDKFRQSSLAGSPVKDILPRSG